MPDDPHTAMARARGSERTIFREIPGQNEAIDSPPMGDVELDVRIELGRARLRVEEMLALEGGAVVELDRAAGDPVDVFVNDRLVARGELIVIDENFGVRICEI